MKKGEERTFSTKSPDVEWDYVVIGSGMGGLSSATILSQMGKRVLVLEQHYEPGGFTHTFKRKRWRWDVGVHAVGDVHPKAILGRFLRKMSRGTLEWANLGKVYDEFYFPGLRIDFPDSLAQFRQNLVEVFPAEEKAIDEYLRLVGVCSDKIRPYYVSRILSEKVARIVDRTLVRGANELLTKSTQSVLDTITNSDRLKTVLTAQWGYYGVEPARSSFAMHALVAKHFERGGFYPKGGSQRIAETLMATIAAAGGWTRIRAEVDQIVIDNGEVKGVDLKTGERIRAKRVVSAAGALATVNRLLPASEREKPWAQSIAKLKPSPCHLCLYIGFKGDIRKAGAGSANKWFYEGWGSNTMHWDVENPTSEAPVLYTSFPSLKDPEHDPGPQELHTGEVVTFVPYDVFAKWRDDRWQKRGQDYEAIKKGIEARMLAQFLKHMPELKSKVAHVELSTPLSTEHFTRAPAGAIYGIEPTPERYLTRHLRPRTPVDGLFLSGSDMASVGVMGAMIGGLLAAAAAEPLGAVKYIRELVAGK